MRARTSYQGGVVEDQSRRAFQTSLTLTCFRLVPSRYLFVFEERVAWKERGVTALPVTPRAIQATFASKTNKSLGTSLFPTLTRFFDGDGAS